MIHNVLVIAEDTHPSYKEIKMHYEVRGIEEAMASFDIYDYVIDCSQLRTQKKYYFIKELARTTKAKIISDLSLSWGEWIYNNCPYVQGAVSTLFYSPSKSLEYSVKDKSDQTTKTVIEIFYQNIGMTPVFHDNLKLAFHYPRVVSMIINEAYFAIEENLATKESIDLAMKHGVNYPLGPFEWGEKIGLSLIIELLRELREVTGEDRYRISHQLKLEAIKL